MKETNDSPSQEIIVETLHPKMMVMSSSQPISCVLFQVVLYPSLDDNDEHKVRYIASMTYDTSYPIIEDVLDDALYCDEDIDQMEEVLIEKYMEQTNKNQGELQSIEDVNNETSMAQLQPPCMEDCDHECKEVEFPLIKEYDYPSRWIIKDNDHLKNEDVESVLIDVVFEESQVIFGLYSKEHHIRNINPFDCIVTHNINYEVDKVDSLKYVIIKEFLELVGDEYGFLCKIDDDQITLEGDMIDDIIKE